MKSIEKASKEVVKYIKTWEMLLFRCDQFVAIPLERRKKDFTPPLTFLSVSLFLLYLIECLYGYLLASTMNLDYPVTLQTTISQGPGKSSLIMPFVEVGLQTALWYLVAYKWLGHRVAVRTPTPLRRIFNELLYINTVITVIMMVWFLGGIFIMGQIVFHVLLPIVHLPAPIAMLFVLPLVVLILVLLFGGFVIPGAYYNTIVMKTLLRMKRGRAVVLSVTISFLAALPFWSYGLAGSQTVPQFLSDREVEAVCKSRAISSVEKYYWEKEGTIVTVAKLTGYLAHLPQDDAWRLKHPNQYSLLLTLTDGAVDGYRFSVEARRRAGVVYALPETLGGLTRHIMMTEIESETTYVEDRPGPYEDSLKYVCVR